MYLTDKELSIRHAVQSDAALLTRWWNDGSIMAHAGFPNGIGTTPEIVGTQLANDSNHGRRLILELNSLPIGEMSYRTKEEGIAEIGIKICDASVRDQGYGTRYPTQQRE